MRLYPIPLVFRLQDHEQEGFGGLRGPHDPEEYAYNHGADCEEVCQLDALVKQTRDQFQNTTVSHVF